MAESLEVAAFVPARIQHRGRSRKVRLVVIHATQSQERRGAARAVANWFTNPDARGSAHITHDAYETIESVKPWDTAAGAPGANEDGYHIEQVGFSEQGTAEWGDDYSTAVIARTAASVRWACAYFGLPRVWLSVADVRAGKAGITDHDTITKATGKGTHWDPGPHYPRAQLMALVNRSAAPPRPPAPPAPPPPEDDTVFFAKRSSDPAVYLFSAGRYEHVVSSADLQQLAAAMGLPAQPAVLTATQWGIVTKGRTLVSTGG